jgi:hypothetical protein
MLKPRNLLILLVVLFTFGAGHARTFTVVGSGGNSTTDDIFNNSEWWTDLFGAYETLINHGIPHSNITVCYGEGHDYISGYDRFRNKWKNEITEITKYNNHKATIQHVLDSLSHVVTGSDTLLFWWVIGHGSASSMNDYYFIIQNEGTSITEAEFTSYVNVINNYAFRMFIWCTCTSGGIRDNLTNSKSVIITCCEYDQNHYASYYDEAPFTNTITAEFSKLIRPILNGHDMFGHPVNGDRAPGSPSRDNRMDFTELKDSIQEHYVNSYGNTVCIGDLGNNAATTYPVDGPWRRSLEIKQAGVVKGRLSEAGYLQIQGTGITGGLSGLILKKTSGISFTTTGELVRSSVTNYDFLWLSTPANFPGNLIIKNSKSTEVAAGIQSNGSLHLRGWESPNYPRFNF